MFARALELVDAQPPEDEAPQFPERGAQREESVLGLHGPYPDREVGHLPPEVRSGRAAPPVLLEVLEIGVVPVVETADRAHLPLEAAVEGPVFAEGDGRQKERPVVAVAAPHVVREPYRDRRRARRLLDQEDLHAIDRRREEARPLVCAPVRERGDIPSHAVGEGRVVAARDPDPHARADGDPLVEPARVGRPDRLQPRLRAQRRVLPRGPPEEGGLERLLAQPLVVAALEVVAQRAERGLADALHVDAVETRMEDEIPEDRIEGVQIFATDSAGEDGRLPIDMDRD